MRRSEALAVALVAFLMAALLLADRFLPSAEPAGQETRPGTFLSTAWYCPIPGGEELSATVGVANLGDESVRLRVWGASERQESPKLDADLAPHSRTSIAVADLGLASPVAVVEAFGTRTSADFSVVGEGSGVASARCSVQPLNRWIFAVASTALHRDTHLIVANPFREEALIKVRLITPEEDVSPARLSDVLIPPLSNVAVFLADYYPETESFGVEVVATRGRVLVSRSIRMDPASGARGLGIDIGVRHPSTTWYFAGGEVPQEGDENLVLVNPSPEEALIRIAFHTETEQLFPESLSELAVPAGRQVVVRVSEHLPRGTRHGTTIESINEVPIVAERFTMGSLAGVMGADSILGQTTSSSRWVAPVGSPFGGSESLAVVNVDSIRASVAVVLITDEGPERPPELGAIAVEGGRRATIDLTPYLRGRPATAVIETVSGTIVVERHLVLEGNFADFADGSALPF